MRTKIGLALSALVLLLIGISCEPEQPEDQGSISLQLIDSRTIDVPEASGLSYDPTTNTLLTVSDGSRDKVYRITTDGVVLDSLYLGGGDMDLEGICVSTDGRTFWIVEEGNRNIVEYDFEGRMLRSFHLDFTGPENSGLEGIAVDFRDSTIYVVNEKNPAVIFKLDFQGNVIAQEQVGAVSDLSGLVFLPDEGLIFAVSDQSGMLIAFTPDLDYTGQNALLDFQNAEGIAINGDTLYLVTDLNSSTSRLYRFTFSVKNP